jgi:hypothetical protein
MLQSFRIFTALLLSLFLIVITACSPRNTSAILDVEAVVDDEWIMEPISLRITSDENQDYVYTSNLAPEKQLVFIEFDVTNEYWRAQDSFEIWQRLKNFELEVLDSDGQKRFPAGDIQDLATVIGTEVASKESFTWTNLYVIPATAQLTGLRYVDYENNTEINIDLSSLQSNS